MCSGVLSLLAVPCPTVGGRIWSELYYFESVSEYLSSVSKLCSNNNMKHTFHVQCFVCRYLNVIGVVINNNVIFDFLSMTASLYRKLLNFWV